MKIGLGLIAHNEEMLITRCLDSFGEIGFDEICLIVNNSTDKTYEKAIAWRMENLNPPMHIEKVEIKPFRFDQARNMYVDYLDSRVDYILTVDVDDFSTPGLETFMKELKAAKTCEHDVIAVQYRTGKDSSHMNFRLFRTKVGVKYEGAVHEYIWCKPEHKRHLAPCEVIHHPTALDHYDVSAQRNLDIFELIGKPTRREIFYYANTLRDMRKFDEAVKAYQDYRTEPYCYYDEWCHTWIYEGRCLRFQGKNDESIKVLSEFVAKDGSWGMAWIELAYNYFFAKKDVYNALAATARAQGCPFRHRLFEEENKAQNGPETIKYLKLAYESINKQIEALPPDKRARV